MLMTSLYMFNCPIFDLVLWHEVQFHKKSSGGCRGEKVKPTLYRFQGFSSNCLTALCELLLFILFSMPVALSKNKFL